MNANIFKKLIIFLITAVLILSTYFYFNKTTEGSVVSSNEITSDYTSLFASDTINDIYIEIEESDLEDILSDPLAEEYKSATVTVNDITVENVGFRTKGNLTLRSVANSDSDRYSFRIKLDKYVEGQNLLGLDEFVINNMYADPSYMREYLSYEALYEVGSIVPLSSYANVYLNGELYGFYLMVEAIDDSFISRNFENTNGNLYKQEQGSTLLYDENSNYDSSELKYGEDDSKSDLKNFIKVLNELNSDNTDSIEAVLDVDSALKYIAANTVLGNYDSYNGNLVQNYYLYSEDGKFTVLPWDYNMSFGGFGGGGNQTTVSIDEPTLGIDIENLPLINNLLSIDSYKEKYYGYIEEFLTYLENFDNRVADLAEVIRPYVNADPTKFYTLEQFESNITYSAIQANSSEGAIQMPEKTSTNTAINELSTPSGLNTNTAPTDRPAPPASSNMQTTDRPAPPTDGNMNPTDRPQPPQGNMPNGAGFNGGNEGVHGGPNNNMMSGISTSIINYIFDRVDYIKSQL